jgi:hypothetical protein
MIRVIGEGALLFLLPFAAFGIVLLLLRRDVLKVESWSPHLLSLVVAGMLLVIGALVYAGVFGETRTGAFEPAHMENGRVVPGRFR